MFVTLDVIKNSCITFIIAILTLGLFADESLEELKNQLLNANDEKKCELYVSLIGKYKNLNPDSAIYYSTSQNAV
jgi:hypothetical protein